MALVPAGVPSALVRRKHKIQKKMKGRDTPPFLSKKDAEDIINSMNVLIEKAEATIAKQKQIESELRKAQTELQVAEGMLAGMSSAIHEDPLKLKEDREIAIQAQKESDDKIRKLKRSIVLIVDYKKLARIEADASAAESEKQSAIRKIEAYHTLLTMCKEAETITLAGRVREINDRASEYLGMFFPDPIQAEFVTEDGTVDLKVHHPKSKGGDSVPIDVLSGGERQRCNMAFLLAIQDVMTSSRHDGVGRKGILLLDECCSNLDEGMSTSILSVIKNEASTDRLVLVVSQETVEGMFDEMLQIGS